MHAAAAIRQRARQLLGVVADTAAHRRPFASDEMEGHRRAPAEFARARRSTGMLRRRAVHAAPFASKLHRRRQIGQHRAERLSAAAANHAAVHAVGQPLTPMPPTSSDGGHAMRRGLER